MFRVRPAFDNGRRLDSALSGERERGQRRIGFVHGVSANALWGLFPLFWPLLKPASANEILAHRIVWSLILVMLLLAVKGQLSGVVELIRRPKVLAALTGAALLMGLNWGVYIYGVNSGQVVQTSLGYFMTPLVSMVFGLALWRESWSKAQVGAVALGSLAVLILSIDYGRPPWIALILGACFGGYGVLKKVANAGALEGLAIETLLLAVPAVCWIGWLGIGGTGTMFSEGPDHLVLLISSGIVTTVPMLLFGAAVTRLPMTTIGFLQYLAPVLQFMIGVLVLSEPMPIARLIGFALIWSALCVLVIDGLRPSRRRSSSVAPIEGVPYA